jgi:hypothetical protein
MTGKESTSEAILNRLLPMQTVKVSPRYEQQVRKFRLTPEIVRELKEKEKQKKLEKKKKKYPNPFTGG